MRSRMASITTITSPARWSPERRSVWQLKRVFARAIRESGTFLANCTATTPAPGGIGRDPEPAAQLDGIRGANGGGEG
jgi:hypothetical protein